MGSINAASAAYIANNDVFSDIFNLSGRLGKNVIIPERLRVMDPKQELVLENGRSVEKIRDVLKIYLYEDGSVAYVLGIENQAKIDYSMVARNLTYDTLSYDRQIKEIKDKHGKRKDIKSSAYPGKFSKKDRVVAVITLTINWGKKKWDAPLSLRDLINTDDPAILEFVPDYRMTVIWPGDFSDEELLSTKSSVGPVFGFIKHSSDRNGLKMFLDKLKALNRQGFGRQETELLNACTNAHLKVPEEGEVTDMCDAFKQERLDGLNEGLALGKVEGLELGLERGKAEGRQETYVSTCKEFGCTYEGTIERFMNKFHVSATDAKEIVNRYWPMN